jgi:hypothetical protein
MLLLFSTNTVLNTVITHLKNCDTDELCDIIEYVSGAGVIHEPDKDMLVLDTDKDQYCGMFDNLCTCIIDEEL